MNPRLSAPLGCALLLAIACGTGCPGPTPAQPSAGTSGGGSTKVRAPGSGTGSTPASSEPGGPSAITPSSTPSASAQPSGTPSTAPSSPGGTPAPTAAPTASPSAKPSAGPTATTFQYFAADLPISQNAGAGGGAVAKLADDGKSLALKLVVVGATGALTGAHVRAGQANQPGTSVHDFAIAEDQRTAATTWRDNAAAPLNAERQDQLKTGQLFIAVDTAINPNGEARGQLMGFAQAFVADLGLVAGVSAPAAKGAAWAAIDGAGKVTLKLYTFGLTGPLTMAHLHQGAASETGPIVKDLVLGADQKTATVTWGTTDATQPLTQALLDALKGGRIYVTCHTPQNAAGEIRGQLLVP